VWSIFSAYPHAKLERIHIEETGNNSFDYFGEGTAERFHA
jgi:6-pyruvoyltetrahydropterin/6-carboxytetrahydropterin synthase